MAMTQADIKLRDNLIKKLKTLDTTLLQRVSDFMEGIAAASTSQTDWWDELPESVKKDHEQGEKDGEEGSVIELGEFLKKYRK